MIVGAAGTADLRAGWLHGAAGRSVEARAARLSTPVAAMPRLSNVIADNDRAMFAPGRVDCASGALRQMPCRSGVFAGHRTCDARFGCRWPATGLLEWPGAGPGSVRGAHTTIWTSSSLHSLGADADSLVRRVGENLTEQVLFRNRKDERGNQLPDPHAPELGFHCKLPDHLLVEGQSS